jgi:ribosomal protein L24
VWAFLVIRPAPAFAQDNSWVDRYHTHIENDMYGTVAWFDEFFEHDLYRNPEDPESSMRLVNDFRYDQEEHFDYRFRVRARIRLPRMKGNMRLLISGENKGKTGRVLQVISDKNRVVVEGVNMVKRHTKPRANQQGGIVEKEAPIHASNVKKVE